MKDTNNYQIISTDIGRGFTKGYTIYNGEEKEFICKSVIGDSRPLDFKEYNNPIDININGNEDYFVGELAEKESYTAIKNVSESKISKTVEVLLYTCLNELAQCENVKVMLGVPYNGFTKANMNDIKDKYQGKELIIRNKITNTTKRILIEDINIFREADASVFHIVQNKNNSKPLGVINAGFRTTELAYYDKGFKFNDSKSRTISYGCQDSLFIIQEMLRKRNINKELNEIDTDPQYDSIKSTVFELMSEKISQQVEEVWSNIDEMDVHITGGNSLNMAIDKRFTLAQDPQMTTAKGLYVVGKEIYA